MNKLRISIIIILNIIIQSTIFSRIEIMGVHPNLSIAIIVALAIGFGSYAGGYGGLIIGLIEDMIFSPIIGVRALSYFIIGFLIGGSEAGINKEDIRTGIIFTNVATIINFFILLLVAVTTQDRILNFSYLFGPIGIEMILNTVVYLIVFYIFKRIFVYPKFRL